MTKKIEVNEDDFKKIMLMLKYSKEFVKLDPTDLFLGNLWRVAPKLVDKIVKKSGYSFVENKGRKTLKHTSEISEDVDKEDGEKEKEEVVEDASEPPTESNTESTLRHRCRKRKRSK